MKPVVCRSPVAVPMRAVNVSSVTPPTTAMLDVRRRLLSALGNDEAGCLAIEIVHADRRRGPTIRRLANDRPAADH